MLVLPTDVGATSSVTDWFTLVETILKTLSRPCRIRGRLGRVLLKLALWQDVHEYLERRTDVVVPSAVRAARALRSLGTDLIVAEELANELGQERHAMVAPAIPFGVSQVHGAFPGTISLKPATVLALVTEAIDSLAQQASAASCSSTGITAARRSSRPPAPRCTPRSPNPAAFGAMVGAAGGAQRDHGDVRGARRPPCHAGGALGRPPVLSALRGGRPPMERFDPVPQPVTWTPTISGSGIQTAGSAAIPDCRAKPLASGSSRRPRAASSRCTAGWSRIREGLAQHFDQHADQHARATSAARMEP